MDVRKHPDSRYHVRHYRPLGERSTVSIQNPTLGLGGAIQLANWIALATKPSARCQLNELMHRPGPREPGLGVADVSGRVNTVNLKDRLRDIQSDRRNLFHDSPPVLAAE